MTAREIAENVLAACESVVAEHDVLPIMELPWNAKRIEIIKRAILDERERCAKIVEELPKDQDDRDLQDYLILVASDLAAEIRKGE